MNRQLLLSISREYGSGGRHIAADLSRRLELPVYDKSILDRVAREQGVDPAVLRRYDERPKNVFTSRVVKGFSNSPEENVARLQFRFLRDKAAAGESFIVLGRCGEEVLRDYDGLISVFILSDIGAKKQRIMDRDRIPEWEALEVMSREDLMRKYYHNQFCKGKWGDSRNYDLTVNSARLGLEGTADLLEEYVRRRLAHS